MLPKILKKSIAADRVAEIAAKLEAARRNLAEKEVAKATASAAAETALAALDAAALAVARRAFEIAEADHRDALALFDAASAALDAAEDEAAAERWRDDAKAYRNDVEAFERATRADLSTMGEIARRIVAAVVNLEARKRDLDGRQPMGEPAVPPAEGWRTVPGRPEEVAEEETRDAWVYASTGYVVPPERVAHVSARGDRGSLLTAGGASEVIRRRVLRRTILERVDALRAVPLASALSVPGATAEDRAEWTPTAAPAAALEMLSVSDVPRKRAIRVVTTVLD